ncbi:MAG: EAL domain-containing protein [Sulfuritalea sp.]|nr:EAL domain-containing protein [Sulfuritalea sp.]
MSPPEQIRPSEVRILIVEDSPTQAEQLRQLLTGHGFGVAVAGNGREALAAALAHPPTLVITDIVMPEMDGYELCAALKADAQLKDIPVVMVTSLAGIQDIARSLECGADNFIRKPYEPKALLSRIEYILLNLELRKTSRLRMGMEIYMGGKKHFIASGREQIVDLLISTYEEAVRMNEELQQQQQEIALSNRTLRVLYRIAADLNRVSTEVEVCEQALQGILELSGFRAGWVFLDQGEGALRLAAARELPGVLLGPGAMEGDCRCRRMLQTGELRRGAALVECERLQKHGGDAVKMRSHVSTPLSAGHQILGIMNVVGDESGVVGADDLRLLEAVGSQVAVAIQRAQLYQHLEALVGQRTAALQAEIAERTRAQAKVASLNRIYAVLSGINTTIVRVHDRLELFQEACRIAVELGKFRLAWIGLVESDGGCVRPVAWQGECGESALAEDIGGNNDAFGQALRERTTVVCNDLEISAESLFPPAALASGCRSMAVFPLLLGGRANGLLALYADQRDVFDAAELALLNEIAGDISFALEYIEKSERIDYLAYYDVLTGLPNRHLIHDRLTQLLAARREQGGLDPVAVVLINIERFKSINDSFGRHRGDALLKLIADRLCDALGSTDHLARIGADHFAAVVARLGDAADIARILDDSILPSLAQPFDIDGKELHIAVRSGIALFPADGNDADTLFANAETALRKANSAGKRYLFYAPQMNARVAEQLTLENKLHRALERREFVLHYQPKVELGHGEVVGLEALLRWQDPTGGLVSPVDFIPILEETGLIVDVGRWALEQGIADYWAWHAAGLHPPRVAVNVSAVQLRREDFLEMMKTMLALHGGEHNYLDLELTEALLIADIEANVRCLATVRKMGVRIAVDDFGTGYSSLNYLKRFPIDYLKIDQSFVRDITTTPDAAAICIAIIDLAHNLKLKVIAEGVETEGQMNYLRRHGCDEMQGFLFSQPLPADECAQLLKARTTLALPSAAESERKTLLIVDDEPGVLSALKRVLRRDGYEILAVGSAREGFDVLATHEVQVIISDQRMPEMNGSEFLSRVRELYPDTIRIVLSGYTDLDTIVAAVNHGAIYRFLTKPWDDDLLREHIREAFRHQETAQRKS